MPRQVGAFFIAVRHMNKQFLRKYYSEVLTGKEITQNVVNWMWELKLSISYILIKGDHDERLYQTI
jgi:hypothetical protein